MSLAEVPADIDLDAIDLLEIFELDDVQTIQEAPPSHILTDAEAELVEETGRNPKHVGKIISKGVQSVVREFQDDKVIKLPVGYISNAYHSKIMHAIIGQNFGQAQYEYLISRKHIGPDIVVPTEFYSGKDSRRFVSIQPFKELEMIEREDLKRGSKTRSEMIQLLKGNGELYRERKYALDASGFDLGKICRGKPYLYNISRDTETGKLCIIDTGLLDYQTHAAQILFQRWNMWRLGLDFFGRNKE